MSVGISCEPPTCRICVDRTGISTLITNIRSSIGFISSLTRLDSTVSVGISCEPPTCRICVDRTGIITRITNIRNSIGFISSHTRLDSAARGEAVAGVGMRYESPGGDIRAISTRSTSTIITIGFISSHTRLDSAARGEAVAGVGMRYESPGGDIRAISTRFTSISIRIGSKSTRTGTGAGGGGLPRCVAVLTSGALSTCAAGVLPVARAAVPRACAPRTRTRSTTCRAARGPDAAWHVRALGACVRIPTQLIAGVVLRPVVAVRLSYSPQVSHV